MGSAGDIYVDTCLTVRIEFRLARPAGHYGTGRNAGKLLPSAPKYPGVKPDVDKLTRTTLDAMTGVVFDDDSRIVRLEATKVYAEAGQHEGASITITPT